ncbi:MAG TPA: hypothetical protein VL359_17205 [bacterium]|nr:hypothetical protein [bacterium]
MGAAPQPAILPAGPLAGPLLGLLAAGLLASLLLTLGPPCARAQTNFKPLERNDVTEVEQHLNIARALQVGGDYALTTRQNQDKDLVGINSATTFDQDFRLHLKTSFNEDISMVLTAETSTTSLQGNNWRATPSQSGQIANSSVMTLDAREAYLQDHLNPHSVLTLGKYELSLGDRRGKVFDAISSGADFDCRLGTWCMPFGVVKTGDGTTDWTYHWALSYRGFDDIVEGFHRQFEVEIFRIIYTEFNVPLGTNLGPGTFNPSNPTAASSTLLPDNAKSPSPFFYDATAFNYFGLRTNWEETHWYIQFDFTTAQGSRDYHLFPDPNTGAKAQPEFQGGVGPADISESISGSAAELDVGFRWAPQERGRLGLRAMSATGDSNQLQVVNGAYVSPNGDAFRRGLNGYYEITPGSYRGTRLYFNGFNSQVDLGGGLGHSINNKLMGGIYLDYADPDQLRLGYSVGLYQIALNNAILNAAGKSVNNVGTELDNMLTWYLHRQMRLQFEINLLQGEGAMSFSDFIPPPTDQQLFVQSIFRLVYQF